MKLLENLRQVWAELTRQAARPESEAQKSREATPKVNSHGTSTLFEPVTNPTASETAQTIEKMPVRRPPKPSFVVAGRDSKTGGAVLYRRYVDTGEKVEEGF
jgi:hypothetical protein